MSQALQTSSGTREFIEIIVQLKSNTITDTVSPQLIQSFLARAEQ